MIKKYIKNFIFNFILRLNLNYIYIYKSMFDNFFNFDLYKFERNYMRYDIHVHLFMSNDFIMSLKSC